jgi:hypothetical protein
VAALRVLLCALAAGSAVAYNVEDYEESAGGSAAFLLNPRDGIYGISVGSGTWLRNTPVFGDYFLDLFSNSIEDSWYTGAGMTLRLMPHWRLAPFVGAGGSYNYSLSNHGSNDVISAPQSALPKRGESYWGGHVETGFRFWTGGIFRLFELNARYTWSALQGERDYWQIGIATGTGY